MITTIFFNKMKIINSAAYEDLADFKILFLKDLQKFMQNFQLLKQDAVIYCKTDFTPGLFEHLKFSVLCEFLVVLFLHPLISVIGM